MKILGISGAVGHDASAALLVDGKLVAACEEERLIRDKHAKNKMPLESAKWCLEHANLKPEDIDLIVFPYAEIGLNRKDRWHYAKRYWYAPDRALDALFNGNRRYRKNMMKLRTMLADLGFDLQDIMKNNKIIPVEHHLSHASSAYHLSNFPKDKKIPILGVDGKGEYATTFFGYGENGKIHKIKEFYDPDSIGGVYGAITQYLGFEMLDGEFKVMGMAPYGDPYKFDLSELIKYRNGEISVNTKLVNTIGLRRYKNNNQGYYFSKKLIKKLGPKREGDSIDYPYIHYAAAMQKLLEDLTCELVEYYLGDLIRDTGYLCFAGGVALNVKLNKVLMEKFKLKELFVQPAAGDAGTAIGAATYVAAELEDNVLPQEHVYLGPEYTNKDVIKACEEYGKKHNKDITFKKLENATATGADILAKGNPLAWFQGRMEFGPRALGNRSILGDPGHKGIADRINAQIKYRERWRPFCPSMLDSVAHDILQTEHPAPYMTFAFTVADSWKDRIPEVVHEDGTARAQVVSSKTNPKYHQLITNLEKMKGHAVVLNTSLNKRGEPMVCSPYDALNMFYNSDLEYLIMEDILITK